MLTRIHKTCTHTQYTFPIAFEGTFSERERRVLTEGAALVEMLLETYFLQLDQVCECVRVCVCARACVMRACVVCAWCVRARVRVRACVCARTRARTRARASVVKGCAFPAERHSSETRLALELEATNNMACEV